MYCDKCGTFLQEGAVFCNKCGNLIDSKTISYQGSSLEVGNNSGKGYYGTIITSVLMIFMMLFQKWIQIPFFDEKVKFSMFQVFDIVEYGDVSVLFYIIVGLLILIVLAAALLFVLHIVQTIKEHTPSKLAILASIMYCLAFVVGIIALIVANLIIQRGSFGLFDNALSFTFSVYLTLIVAIVNIVVTSKSFNKK